MLMNFNNQFILEIVRILTKSRKLVSTNIDETRVAIFPFNHVFKNVFNLIITLTWCITFSNVTVIMIKKVLLTNT